MSEQTRRDFLKSTAVAGTALQQRLANRTLSLAFAALLAALGVRMLV